MIFDLLRKQAVIVANDHTEEFSCLTKNQLWVDNISLTFVVLYLHNIYSENSNRNTFINCIIEEYIKYI
jgi:hypothetical protein